MPPLKDAHLVLTGMSIISMEGVLIYSDPPHVPPTGRMEMTAYFLRHAAIFFLMLILLSASIFFRTASNRQPSPFLYSSALLTGTPVTGTCPDADPGH